MKLAMRDVLTLPGVVFLDAVESCSCIEVGISDPGAAAAVQQFASSAGLASGRVRTVATPVIVQRSTLQEELRPVKGGLQIRNDTAVCTLTATVFHRARARKGILTNSHCTNTQGGTESTTLSQPSLGFLGVNAIAFEALDPPFVASLAGCPTQRTCRRSDSAYADFSGASTTGIVGRIAMPSQMCTTGACGISLPGANSELRIVGVGGGPTLGAHVHKVGRTSGWTSGVVARTCLDSNIFRDDDTDTGLTLLCQHQARLFSDSGDSGSPVFELLSGNRAVLLGVLWGGPKDDLTTTFYSALPDVEAELGAMDFFEP
jgi:hypothetical protein